MKKISVAIADDQKLFRKGMASLIHSFDHMSLVIEAENGKQLIERIDSGIIPEVILMDLEMPEMNGIDATVAIRAKYPEVKIVVISAYEEARFIAHMVENGANGYLDKNADPEEVQKAIQAVMDSDFYFNAATLAAMRQAQGRQRVALNNRAALTQREVEVLQLICKEHTAAEIAEKLFISIRTAEGHRNNLLDKTGARNTAGLVIFAMQNNIIMGLG